MANNNQNRKKIPTVELSKIAKTAPKNLAEVVTTTQENLLKIAITGKKTASRMVTMSNRGVFKTKKSGNQTHKINNTEELKILSIVVDQIIKIYEIIGNDAYNKLLTGIEKGVIPNTIIVGTNGLVLNALNRIKWTTSRQYFLFEEMNRIEREQEIIQAAREGVLLKEEKRTVKGNPDKEIIYDVTISEDEVKRAIDNYRQLYKKIDVNKWGQFSLIALYAIMPAIMKKKETPSEINKTIIEGISSVGLIELTKSFLQRKINNSFENTIREKEGRRADFLNNAFVSHGEKEDKTNELKMTYNKEAKVTAQIGKSDLIFSVTKDLVVLLLSGKFIYDYIQKNFKGQINAQTILKAYATLSAAKEGSAVAIDLLESTYDLRNNMKEFLELYEFLDNIETQMREKRDCLKGAKSSFDTLEIKNASLKLRVCRAYEDGKKRPAKVIHVSDFHIKRGEVVLISGNKGSGKTSFLNLLRSGDINNRGCLILDGKEKVDNLGNQVLSSDVSMTLGNNSSLLFQITGKKHIDELSSEGEDSELSRLQNLINELGFEDPNILNKLSQLKYQDFSEGEKKSLKLLRLFYRISGKESIMILDEPIDNVEDKLIKKQFELVSKIAKRHNIAILMVTHRKNIARKVVDREYEIDYETGVMQERNPKEKDEQEDYIEEP